MKRIFLLPFLICLTFWSYAQTNIFPTSGNVGIGTTTPSANLQIVGNAILGQKSSGANSVRLDLTSGASNKEAIIDFGYYTTYDASVWNIGRWGDGSFRISNFISGAENNRFLINSMGRICIGGNGAPAGLLDIYGDPSVSGNEVYLTGQASSANQNSNSLRLNFVGYAQKAGYAIQAVNVGSYGIKDLVFYGHNATDYTTYQEVVRFRYNGKVGIGTASPQAKLDVNGNIYTNGKLFIGTPDANTVNEIAPYALAVEGAALFTKAVVKLQADWPDYVFDASYQLPHLDSLAKFIKVNGHLPEIPTSEEVKKDGINLGGNQTILLKKIEELTLLLIEQNKRIEELESKMEDKE